jgi:hypothetical protein
MNERIFIVQASSANLVQIAGNGKGSALSRVVGPLNLTAPIANRIATISDLTSMATGQLAVTTDGFWGTIVDFPTNTDQGAFTTQAAGDTLTKTSHGIGNGTRVYVYQSGQNVVPAPLIAGKIYFVVGTAANTLQLSLTSGGAAINITGTDTTVGLKSLTTDNIQVDQWRGVNALTNNNPVAGASNVNIFPAGSILAGAKSVRIERILGVKGSAGAETLAISDYDPANPLWTVTNPAANTAQAEFTYEVDLSSIFLFQASAVTGVWDICFSIKW